MTKSTGVGRGGYRKGARRPKLPNIVKREKQIISFQAGDFAYFVAVMGSVEAAKKQIEQWVRAYPMARGETDRLLAQSPLAAELLAYLETTDAPEQLRDQLESLIVQRASDEVKIAEGVTQVGESFVV
jgi:hypothetical protein